MKIQSLFVVFIMLVFLPSRVFAENGSNRLIQVKRDAMVTAAEERRSNIDKIREDADQKIEERRQAFQEKLSSFRDQRKRTVVENVSEKIAILNKRWTERWTESLNRLSELLLKIEERVANDDRDTAETKRLIEEAKVSIENAQTAVNEQAGNVYVIEINEEERVREDVQKTVIEFREDLRTVHTLIKDVHELIRLIISSLK